jgi:hypothetical protein
MTLEPDQLNPLRLFEDAYNELPEPAAPSCVAISFHVITQSNGAGGISQAALDQAIAALNSYYNGSGFQFTQLRPTWTIANDAYYVSPESTWTQFIRVNPVPGSINIFIHPRSAGPCLGTFPNLITLGQNLQGVVLSQDCVQDAGVVCHEVGHYLNLYHTHEQDTFGPEFPGGSNCVSAGDLLCDTPADPGLYGGTYTYPACQYIGTAVCMFRGCEGSTYNPSTHNIMSYAQPCRSELTAGQFARAELTLRARLRANLSIPCQSPPCSYPVTPGWVRDDLCARVCYANCDSSTVSPILNTADFSCFMNAYAAAQELPVEDQIVSYANCDGSTISPVLNSADFSCFMQRYSAGCQ